MTKTNNEIHFILIDDNKVDLLHHEKLIRNKGISTTITAFSDATLALTYLITAYEEGNLAEQLVILLDIQMPVMDGFAFLDHLEDVPQAILARIRIFCVSSTQDPAIIKRCKAYPLVDGFLKKPLKTGQLTELLNSPPIG